MSTKRRPKLEGLLHAKTPLCAAASDLLAACKFTLSVMQSNHLDVELSERLAISKLEAAIAQATSPQSA